MITAFEERRNARRAEVRRQLPYALATLGVVLLGGMGAALWFAPLPTVVCLSAVTLIVAVGWACAVVLDWSILRDDGPKGGREF